MLRRVRAMLLLVIVLVSGCIPGVKMSRKEVDLVFGVTVLSEAISEQLPEFAYPHVRVVAFSTSFEDDKQVITLDLENAGTDSDFYISFYRVPVGQHFPLEFSYRTERFEAPQGWTGSYQWTVVLNGSHHVAQVRVYSVSPGAPDHLHWMIDQKYILPE